MKTAGEAFFPMSFLVIAGLLIASLINLSAAAGEAWSTAPNSPALQGLWLSLAIGSICSLLIGALLFLCLRMKRESLLFLALAAIIYAGKQIYDGDGNYSTYLWIFASLIVVICKLFSARASWDKHYPEKYYFKWPRR